MDWAHVTLAGIIVLTLVLRLFTRRKRSLRITVDWEEEGPDGH